MHGLGSVVGARNFPGQTIWTATIHAPIVRRDVCRSARRRICARIAVNDVEHELIVGHRRGDVDAEVVRVCREFVGVDRVKRPYVDIVCSGQSAGKRDAAPWRIAHGTSGCGVCALIVEFAWFNWTNATVFEGARRITGPTDVARPKFAHACG